MEDFQFSSLGVDSASFTFGETLHKILIMNRVGGAWKSIRNSSSLIIRCKRDGCDTLVLRRGIESMMGLKWRVQYVKKGRG